MFHVDNLIELHRKYKHGQAARNSVEFWIGKCVRVRDLTTEFTTAFRDISHMHHHQFFSLHHLFEDHSHQGYITEECTPILFRLLKIFINIVVVNDKPMEFLLVRKDKYYELFIDLGITLLKMATSAQKREILPILRQIVVDSKKCPSGPSLTKNEAEVNEHIKSKFSESSF